MGKTDTIIDKDWVKKELALWGSKHKSRSGHISSHNCDGLILKIRRKELGLSQQGVADAAGIQLRQYQRFELGERYLCNASMKIGLAICSVLKLDPYTFTCN